MCVDYTGLNKACLKDHFPFGLKNAGATYQRCRQHCFTDQIDPLDQPDQAERPKPTIAVYVDDIMVKTAQARDLIADLATTFVNL